jgi:hypothetical protein
MYIPKSIQVDVLDINDVQYSIKTYRHLSRKEKIKRLFQPL